MTKSDFLSFIEKKGKYLQELEQIVKAIKKDDGFELNYEQNTIDFIQELYYDVFSEKCKVDIPKSEFRLLFWMYLGEAVIQHLGGEWTLAPKNDEANGTPIIENWGGTKNKPRISPFVWENLLIKGKLRENISRLILRMQATHK